MTCACTVPASRVLGLSGHHCSCPRENVVMTMPAPYLTRGCQGCLVIVSRPPYLTQGCQGCLVIIVPSPRENVVMTKPAPYLTRWCQGCLLIIVPSPQRKCGADNKPFPFKQMTWTTIYASHFCSKSASKTLVVRHLWLQKRLGNRLLGGNHVHR